MCKFSAEQSAAASQQSSCLPGITPPPCSLNRAQLLATVPDTPAAPTYLGRKMHDSVYLLGLQHKADQVHRLDVALDELHNTASSRRKT